MTEQENIVKGLSCLLQGENILWDSCNCCPFNNTDEGCFSRIITQTILLLKKQKEEISSLKEYYSKIRMYDDNYF